MTIPEHASSNVDRAFFKKAELQQLAAVLAQSGYTINSLLNESEQQAFEAMRNFAVDKREHRLDD